MQFNAIKTPKFIQVASILHKFNKTTINETFSTPVL